MKLTRNFFNIGSFLPAPFLVLALCPAQGGVVYRGLQDSAIPADFAGVYVNIDSGAVSGSELPGWDVNFFFGGVGVANSPAFQPARTGTMASDPVRAFALGDTIGPGLSYQAGYGGSDSHLGGGDGQFSAGEESYLGFRFMTDGNLGPYFGWMRVILNPDLDAGIIKDWAYETSGLAIQTGNLVQSPPVNGVSTVDLSGEGGQTLSDLAVLPGVSFALVKSGGGTWTIATPGNFSSLTATGGITQLNVALENAAVTVDNFAVVQCRTDQTLSELNIGDGAVVILDIAESNVPAPAALPVPEPGGMGALAAGAACFLVRRFPRRR